MSGAYLGYASEDDYHAHYTLANLVDDPRTRPRERKTCLRLIREIDQRKGSFA